MEGLHNRKKDKVNEEDEAEFLDEEGFKQARLLQLSIYKLNLQY